MAETKINMRVDDDRKVAYEARAAELGMSVSSWLRSLADNDCDPVATEVAKPAPKDVTKAPKETAVTKVVKKAGIEIAVPVAKAGRECGHMYCKLERGKGKVGDCFL